MVSTHLKNISENGTSSPNRGENKKCLKPPGSFVPNCRSVDMLLYFIVTWSYSSGEDQKQWTLQDQLRFFMFDEAQWHGIVESVKKSQNKNKHNRLVVSTHLKNISEHGKSSPNRGENKKCLKPPGSFVPNCRSVDMLLYFIMTWSYSSGEDQKQWTLQDQLRFFMFDEAQWHGIVESIKKITKKKQTQLVGGFNPSEEYKWTWGIFPK